MGCRYEWADDSHLILNIFIETPWTWEEYDSVTGEIFAKMKETGKPCATAVDVSKMGRMPKGNAIAHLSNMEKMMPDNVFASAIVGAPYMATAFMDILMRIRPRAKRLALFTKTMAEAHQKIQQQYQELYVVAEKKLD